MTNKIYTPDTAVKPNFTALPIYVISLDRTPERRDHMREQMSHAGLSYEVVSAVDGQNPITELDSIYNQKKRLRLYGADLSRTEIACCLSHLKVCRLIAKSETGIGLILEDDVLLSDAVAPVLAEISQLERSSFDVIRLAGLRQRRSKVARQLSNLHNIVRLNIGPCGSQAYIITAAGALKLIDYCTPIVQQIDIALDEILFNRLNSYAVLPYPVSCAASIASSIGQRNDKQEYPAGLYQEIRRTTRRNIGILYTSLRMYLTRSDFG